MRQASNYQKIKCLDSILSQINSVTSINNCILHGLSSQQWSQVTMERLWNMQDLVRTNRERSGTELLFNIVERKYTSCPIQWWNVQLPYASYTDIPQLNWASPIQMERQCWFFIWIKIYKHRTNCYLQQEKGEKESRMNGITFPHLEQDCRCCVSYATSTHGWFTNSQLVTRSSLDDRKCNNKWKHA